MFPLKYLGNKKELRKIYRGVSPLMHLVFSSEQLKLLPLLMKAVKQWVEEKEKHLL
jgi:hypothetical protein